MALIKCVDRYVGITVIKGILLAWAVLMTLMMVLNFVGELKGGQGGYGAVEALWYVLLTVPRNAYITFPVAALVGALIGAGGLAAGFELTAFRAAGVSRLRLSVAALLGGAILLIPVFWIGEYLAPQAEQYARTFRLLNQDGRIHLGGRGGMWVRDANDFINIKSPVITSEGQEKGVSYDDIVIYSVDEQHKVSAVTRAATALPEDDGWQLANASRLLISDEQVSELREDRLRWSTAVDRSLLDSAVTRPRYLSIGSLLDFQNYLDTNGQDASQYSSALWNKLFYPFTVLALILSGMPFVFGTNRQQKLGLRMFIGIALGAIYLLFSRSISNFGDVYGMHPALSAALPIMLLVAVAIWSLRRTP